MSEEEFEDSLNIEIEESLIKKDLKQAARQCVKFVSEVYGKDAVGVWALKDFYREHVEHSTIRTRFDNNLESLMQLRQEKIMGWDRPKYESPYFEGEYLEQLDSAFEEYMRRADHGKPGKQKFINLVKRAVEELPLI